MPQPIQLFSQGPASPPPPTVNTGPSAFPFPQEQQQAPRGTPAATQIGVMAAANPTIQKGLGNLIGRWLKGGTPSANTLGSGSVDTVPYQATSGYVDPAATRMAGPEMQGGAFGGVPASEAPLASPATSSGINLLGLAPPAATIGGAEAGITGATSMAALNGPMAGTALAYGFPAALGADAALGSGVAAGDAAAKGGLFAGLAEAAPYAAVAI